MKEPASKEEVNAAIAIVTRGSQLLIAQRVEGDSFGGFWEFPGGKCEDGETLEQCLARELREELNIVAKPIDRFPAVEHEYPHVLVRLHPFLCEHVEGEPQTIECQAFRWIDPPQLRDFQFPPANEELIERVIARLS